MAPSALPEACLPALLPTVLRLRRGTGAESLGWPGGGFPDSFPLYLGRGLGKRLGVEWGRLGREVIVLSYPRSDSDGHCDPIQVAAIS